MRNQQHFQRLEQDYLSAPANFDFISELKVNAGTARVTFDVEEEDQDAAGVIDRALYFKVLHDAARLAANSLVEDRYVAVESFNLYVTRPVATGPLTARARVLTARGTIFTVEVVLVDEQGHRLAHGHGIFVRGTTALPDTDYDFIDDAPLDDAEDDAPDLDVGDEIYLVPPQVVWQTPFGLVYPN